MEQTQSKPKAALVLGKWKREHIDEIYPPSVLRDLENLCDFCCHPITPDEMPAHADALAQTELLFSGWGPPRLDRETLNRMPRLRAVFYGAGSIASLVTEDFWKTDLPVCSAWGANAVPVVEYTLAQIILCLKRAHVQEASYGKTRERDAWKAPYPLGAYGATVGLLSLGQIGRNVSRRLQALDVHVLAYDPYADSEAAADCGCELVPLDELFRRSNVLSVHTPRLPETEGMVTADLLRSLPSGASFINTARGAVVDQPALEKILAERPDLYAVLDVTDPEPLPKDSPLFDLPNVFLTPHIAGSQGRECARMGRYMVEECARFLQGEPLRWRITREQFQRMA